MQEEQQSQQPTFVTLLIFLDRWTTVEQGVQVVVDPWVVVAAKVAVRVVSAEGNLWGFVRGRSRHEYS